MTGPVFSVEPGAISFIEDPYATGLTDDEITIVLNGGELPRITINSLDPALTAAQMFEFASMLPTTAPAVVAAAEVMTGAMIAFAPSDADAQRLALPNGEPVDQLHCTSIYLGDAVDFGPDDQQNVIDFVTQLVADMDVINANIFGFDILNPKGDSPCLVLNVGGDELASAQEILSDVFEELGMDLPDQHQPWLAHITLIYEDDPRKSLTDDVLALAGPIVFDKIRVAFAGDVTDIPLGADVTAALEQFHLPGKHNQDTHGHGVGEHASIREVQMGEKLNSGKRLDLSDPDERKLALGIAAWTGGGHEGLGENEIYLNGGSVVDKGGTAGTSNAASGAISKFIQNGGHDPDGIPSEQATFSFVRTVAAAPLNGPELHRAIHDVHISDVPQTGDVFDFGPTSFSRSRKRVDEFAMPRHNPPQDDSFLDNSVVVRYTLKKGNRSLRIDQEAGVYKNEQEHVVLGRVRVTGRKESVQKLKNADGKKGRYKVIELELESTDFEVPTTRYPGGAATRSQNISANELYG